MTPSELAGELETSLDCAPSSGDHEITVVPMFPNHLRLIVQHLRTLTAAQEECEKARYLEELMEDDTVGGELIDDAVEELRTARAKHDAAKGGKVDG